MEIVTASSSINNYTWPYTNVGERFNELEKLFFVVGQEIKSILYKHAEYVDSYRVLCKSSYLIDSHSIQNGNIQPRGFIDGLYDLVTSFAPNSGISNIESLKIYWSKLLQEAITPVGLSDFIKFLVGIYIVDNDIDSGLYEKESTTLLERVLNATTYVNTYIHEWSNPEEVQVGQHYFYPGMLGFMEIAILIGLDSEIYSEVNLSSLSIYVYNQLQEVKETKLTPSLSIVFINVTEDWENG